MKRERTIFHIQKAGSDNYYGSLTALVEANNLEKDYGKIHRVLSEEREYKNENIVIRKSTLITAIRGRRKGKCQ